MTLARPVLASVAVLALLTACGGGSDAGTAPSGSATTPSTSASAPAPEPSESSSPTPGSSSTGITTSLEALQLCGTTLGYAAGALAGVSAEQLATFEAGVTSAQSKARAAEAELVAQSQAVLAAGRSGDKAAISTAGERMGELCGAG